MDISLVKYYLKKYNLFTIFKENNLLKSWKLMSPIGIEYETNNISNFAKEHNISHQMLRSLAHKRCNYYKGWTCNII